MVAAGPQIRHSPWHRLGCHHGPGISACSSPPLPLQICLAPQDMNHSRLFPSHTPPYICLSLQHWISPWWFLLPSKGKWLQADMLVSFSCSVLMTLGCLSIFLRYCAQLSVSMCVILLCISFYAFFFFFINYEFFESWNNFILTFDYPLL